MTFRTALILLDQGSIREFMTDYLEPQTNIIMAWNFDLNSRIKTWREVLSWALLPSSWDISLSSSTNQPLELYFMHRPPKWSELSFSTFWPFFCQSDQVFYSSMHGTFSSGAHSKFLIHCSGDWAPCIEGCLFWLNIEFDTTKLMKNIEPYIADD